MAAAVPAHIPIPWGIKAGLAIALVVGLALLVQPIRSRMGKRARAIVRSSAWRSPHVAFALGALGVIASGGLALAGFHNRPLGVALLVAAGLGFCWWISLVVHEHRGPKRDLKWKCQILSQEIHDLAADSRQGLTGAGWDAKAMSDRYDQILGRYNRRCHGPAVALLDQLDAHKLVDYTPINPPGLVRMMFERPTNSLGLDHVARTLGAAAEKIKD